MVDYFKSEKINTAVTAIRSRSGEIMYLIEGLEKAILIDTCVGIKEFRNFVENLTRKPITVLITHGHMDHANFMGNINYVAKRATPQFIREDGGEGNIVYNKKKVMKMV